jgi:hypothetical protein
MADARPRTGPLRMYELRPPASPVSPKSSRSTSPGHRPCDWRPLRPAFSLGWSRPASSAPRWTTRTSLRTGEVLGGPEHTGRETPGPDAGQIRDADAPAREPELDDTAADLLIGMSAAAIDRKLAGARSNLLVGDGAHAKPGSTLHRDPDADLRQPRRGHHRLPGDRPGRSRGRQPAGEVLLHPDRHRPSRPAGRTTGPCPTSPPATPAGRELAQPRAIQRQIQAPRPGSAGTDDREGPAVRQVGRRPRERPSHRTSDGTHTDDHRGPSDESTKRNSRPIDARQRLSAAARRRRFTGNTPCLLDGALMVCSCQWARRDCRWVLCARRTGGVAADAGGRSRPGSGRLTPHGRDPETRIGHLHDGGFVGNGPLCRKRASPGIPLRGPGFS